MGTHETTTNKSVEWYTPVHVFRALGLEFDIDPCHPDPRLPWVPARQVYSLPQDGLQLHWPGRFWLNPPYGPEVPKWLAKVYEQEMPDGVSLLNSRTDTRWFHEYVTRATAICFVKGRIFFVDRHHQRHKSETNPGGSPGVGQILIAWGDECAAALAGSGLGFTVPARAAEKYSIGR